MLHFIHQALADELYEAWRTRTLTERLSVRYPGLTAEDAYAILHCNRRRAEAMGYRVVGYKIGLSSAAAMKSLGVTEPDYGFLFDGMAVEAGGESPFGGMMVPRVEGEIAFVMGEDLKADATEEDVLAATAYVTASFELVESRVGGPNALVDTLSDNGSAGRYVLSEYHVDPRELDLPNIRLVLSKNGQFLAEGTAEVVMGTPLRSVAWLGNKLRSHGGLLKKGDIILSGALCGGHVVEKGDVFHAEFDRLGELEVSFP